MSISFKFIMKCISEELAAGQNSHEEFHLDLYPVEGYLVLRLLIVS